MCWDEDEKRFQINEMSYVVDKMQTMVQYSSYKNNLYIFRNLSEREEFRVTDHTELQPVEVHVQNLIAKSTFADHMKAYCECRDALKNSKISFSFQNNQMDQLHVICADMERSYPELVSYYDALGSERIRALSYRECNLKREMRERENKTLSKVGMYKMFHIGEELTAEEIKSRMLSVYGSLGMAGKKAKKSDLAREFGFKIREHNRSVGNVRKRMYEIVEMPKMNS